MNRSRYKPSVGCGHQYRQVPHFLMHRLHWIFQAAPETKTDITVHMPHNETLKLEKQRKQENPMMY